MLYDPKWREQNDLSFAGVSLRPLIAWLETKPGDGAYNFWIAGSCLAAQYLQDRGFSFSDSQVSFWRRPEGAWLHTIVAVRPWTYGAALERARKALAG